MKKVVIVNGSAGVGKSSFIQLCADSCEILEFDSVGKEKQLAVYAGWNEVKDEKGRQLLRAFKQARIDYGDLPTLDAYSAIKNFMKDDSNEILFLHIREPEEIEKIKQRVPDILTVLVLNSNIEHVKSNSADANIFDFEYDLVIDNNDSLTGLEDTAATFVGYLRTGL